MKKYFNLTILVLLLGGVIFSQRYFDTARAKEPKPSPYVPSAEIVRALDLGLHSAASSFYWLASIQYIGDWQSDDYVKMDKFLSLSTDLDPKFSHPYAYGTLILPAVNKYDESVKLAEKGLVEADPDWEIPYYLATNYHMYKNDTANAAKYFAIAARTPGAPDNIAWVAANYGSNPDLRSQTIQIWQSIAKNSKDEDLKKRAELYIYHFELMNFLEQAATEYKKQYGSYPDPIEKLVEGKILKEIPKDPFGYTYYIEKETGRARIKL